MPPKRNRRLWPNQKAVEQKYARYLHNTSLDFHCNTLLSFVEHGWTTRQLDESLHSQLGAIAENEYLFNNKKCPIKSRLHDFRFNPHRASFHGKKLQFRIGNIVTEAAATAAASYTSASAGPARKNAADLIKSIECIVLGVIGAAKKLLNMDFKEDDWMATVLQSEANADIQALHCDVNLDMDKELLNNMVEVMIALEDETQFRVVSESHNIEGWTDVLDAGTLKYRKSAVVTLNKGEYLMWHPKLLHSGWSSVKGNKRLLLMLGMKDLMKTIDGRVFYPKQNVKRFLDGTSHNMHCQTLPKKRKTFKSKDTKTWNFNKKK